MPGERVEIIYEASVRGAERVADLSRKTQELEDATNKTSDANRKAAEASKKASDQMEKQNNALLAARKAINDLRKEFFALTFAVGLLRSLAASSDELASRLQSIGRAISGSVLNPLGNMIAKLTTAQGLMGFASGGLLGAAGGSRNAKIPLSDNKQIELLQMQEDIARLRGNSAEALRKKLEAEEIKLNASIQTLSDEKKRIFRAEFEERKKLLQEQQRLEELGLKRQQQIFKDFQKDLIGGFRGSTGETLFNLFEGTSQSGGDILKSFRTSISRALSEALSQSLFSSVLGGGGFSGFFDNFKSILSGKDKGADAAQKTAKNTEDMKSILAQAKECICRTAENTAAMAGVSRGPTSFEGTITPPGTSTLGKIGAISSLVGAISGAGAFAGAASAANALPAGANITNGVPAYMHSGGFVRAYSSGGEVPITAQAGEFVMRKSVSQNHKEFLKDMNLNGNIKKNPMGGGNVFLIKANDASSFASMLSTASSREQLETQVIRAIMGNGNVRKIMKEFT